MVVEILTQLGLDHTFFIAFGVFACWFPCVASVYFEPLVLLFEKRQQLLDHEQQRADDLSEVLSSRLAEFQKQEDEDRHQEVLVWEREKQALEKEKEERLHALNQSVQEQIRAEERRLADEAAALCYRWETESQALMKSLTQRLLEGRESLPK